MLSYFIESKTKVEREGDGNFLDKQKVVAKAEISIIDKKVVYNAVKIDYSSIKVGRVFFNFLVETEVEKLVDL